MLTPEREAFPAGWCSLLLCVALIPGAAAGYLLKVSGYVHEGVGAAYFIPLAAAIWPLVFIAEKCFARAGKRGTKSFTLVLGCVVLSVLMLVAPYVAMRFML